ncbi:hypothetical protein WOLCODRAFT_166391 [Wolfiporia cocos MD-104 SS10]|uniref:Protein kinase domain-containing protein n=1 Tax=Wolfiporia cocos (strain MD-104) TaxID=742152 RepID=A0A2H3J106_WOLCO|nr:hypothetical protein WOLCODRAFT_166391 [Wolfiporia cocos MD-104 SS10]
MSVASIFIDCNARTRVCALAEAIGDEMRPQVDASYIILWKPKEPLPAEDEAGKDAGDILQEKLENPDLSAVAIKLDSTLPLETYFGNKDAQRDDEVTEDAQRDDEVILVDVIVQLNFPSRKRLPTDEDLELSKRQRRETEEIRTGIQVILAGRKRLLAGLNGLPPPSEAGKTSFVKNLVKESQPLLKAGRPYGAIGPLISIYHPVVTNFLDLLACPDICLDSDVLAKTQQLVEASSKFYPNEGVWQHEINRQLSDFLGINITPMTLSDQSSNDGLILVRCSKIDKEAAPVFLKYEDEADRVSTEPCMQAAFRYARFYIKHGKGLLDYWCCPSFTLAITGSALQVSAVALVDDMLVQELTLPLLLKDSPPHFLYTARVLNALKVCIPQLCSFYENLEEPVPRSIGHLLPTSHPTRMPKGKMFAETNQKVKVVVKFVNQYGKRGHELLAKEGLAPALHYFAPLGGGIYVIVMDFVTGGTIFEAKSESLSPDILTDIERAVNLLHTNHLVFGDLRQPNVMVVKREDGRHGAMLIDFDWCGEHGEARYPIQLNKDIDWHSEVVCGGIVAKEHDTYMLSKIRQEFSGR